MRLARVPWLLAFCELGSAFLPPLDGARRSRPASVRAEGRWLTVGHAHDEDGGSGSTGALDASIERVARPFRDLAAEEVLRRLAVDGARRNKVRLGDTGDAPDLTQQLAVSPLERVPGCVSNLRVQTALRWENNTNPPPQTFLRGTSDSLIGHGLLEVLADCLDAQSAGQILGLEPDRLAERLSLRSALSRGRNDGLASIVRTIQSQIRRLLCNRHNHTDPTTVGDERGAVAHSDDAPKTVALLLSGGVDSSVALHLLKRQGYRVTAFYLKIWLEDELAHLNQCPFEDDIAMCMAVCAQANVTFEQVSLQQEYQERVISYTLQEASMGRTPNPDIMCNSRIKFGCFYDAIAGRNFDYIATGHYARSILDHETQQMRLLRAPDPVKDQSYFLCALSQAQLQRVLFPIGHLQKHEVRALAEEFQLPNRHRPDSQGLCFLGKVKFDEFIRSYLGESPGDIVDAATGDILGRHRGLWYHTVGQRKGIGKVLSPLATSRGPWYVVAKDVERNVVLCSNAYDESLFEAARSTFAVENIQWFADAPPSGCDERNVCRLLMKIRHGPRLVEGSLTLSLDGLIGNVCLDEKDGGLAPGQFVVFYSDDECLGCGVISERHWAQFLADKQYAGASKAAIKLS